MTAATMEQKTAVYSFGSLTIREEPRSFDVDEPTRKLPLIAGRFAGREWDEEELKREYRQKKDKKDRKDGDPAGSRLWTILLVLALTTAAVLLTMALLGRAGMTDKNREAAEITREIGTLSRENDDLRLGTARTALLRSDAEETAPVQEDTAVVLSVRRGHELQHIWHSLVDMLGESFH